MMQLKCLSMFYIIFNIINCFSTKLMDFKNFRIDIYPTLFQTAQWEKIIQDGGQYFYGGLYFLKMPFSLVLLFFLDILNHQTCRREDGTEGGAKFMRSHRNEATFEHTQFLFLRQCLAQFTFYLVQRLFHGSPFLNFMLQLLIGGQKFIDNIG